MKTKNLIAAGRKGLRRAAAMLALVSMAFANTAGPNGPGSAAVSGTGATWSSPTNALASDGAFAQAFVTAGGSSNQLQVTNFGFAIPAGSTINGIQVDTQNQSSTPTQLIVVIQALKAGAGAGTAKSGGSGSYPSPEAFVTFGNSTDLWNTTWTPADINNSGFGVQQQALEITGLSGAFANVDFVRITVSFTPPAPPPGGGRHRTIETQMRGGTVMRGS